MDYLRKQFISALGDDCGYDFLANNYWNMDRCAVRDIVLECLYYIHMNERNMLYAVEDIVQELKDSWELD